jgi:hypothetical protein
MATVSAILMFAFESEDRHPGKRIYVGVSSEP